MVKRLLPPIRFHKYLVEQDIDDILRFLDVFSGTLRRREYPVITAIYGSFLKPMRRGHVGTNGVPLKRRARAVAAKSFGIMQYLH